MNSRSFLYIGITINDDEFTSYADFLPYGDIFIIIFDDDHSGSLFQLNDNVLSLVAGSPNFKIVM